MRDSFTPDRAAFGALLVLSSALCGCDPGPSLIELGGWTELSASEDPFTDRPADVICDPIGHRVEEDFLGEPGYGIETGPCGYLTAEQPSLLTVREGETVRVRWFHDVLSASAPAEAHVAVTLAGTTIYEARVPIPSDEGTMEDTWTAPADVPAGSPVLIHLHNHGANTWGLLEIAVVRR